MYILPDLISDSDKDSSHTIIFPPAGTSKFGKTSQIGLISHLKKLLSLPIKHLTCIKEGVQWLSGRVLEWRQGPRVRASPASLCFAPWGRHIYPSLVLVQPRKTCPCLTERLLMGHKESNQTKVLTHISLASFLWDIGKQCKTRSDVAKCGVWSGSPLFAYRSFF